MACVGRIEAGRATRSCSGQSISEAHQVIGDHTDDGSG